VHTRHPSVHHNSLSNPYLNAYNSATVKESAVPKRTRILIVENEPIMAEAMRDKALLILPEAECSMTTTLQAALEWIANSGPPAYVLLDLGLRDSSGIVGFERIREAAPSAQIVIVSGNDDPEIQERAITEGAMAFVRKEYDVNLFITNLQLALKEGIRSFPPQIRSSQKSAVEVRLTEREEQVFRHATNGLSAKQIAAKLQCPEYAVRRHMSHIYQKMGLSSHQGNKRAELVKRRKDIRIIPVDRNKAHLEAS
jgi:DNA-binding NarL/FixJ family response regulator